MSIPLSQRASRAAICAHTPPRCQNCPVQIVPASPHEPDVTELLTQHLREMHGASPACSVHALAIDELAAPHVTLLAARDGEALLGIGAITELDATHGELKSMRTADAARGKGVAAAVLTQLLAIASERGYTRVSLETGSQDFFAPARRLYERHGFASCAPFADSTDDPASAYSSLEVS